MDGTVNSTERSNGDELRRARAQSLRQAGPPAEVPGYEIERRLGSGAYGEVWVGLDENTGRRVAIKFYSDREGLDPSLLAREVEKLAFLSNDRYVVQLLEVGWDADPPYYVMDYIEGGSLEELVARQGPRSPAEALELFREIAVGLMHLHGKGVLHCDLKPANVLLDEHQKPRLADFGQARLPHEPTAALGTLFFMAPEQADLQAVPDARWDVYALGALFYWMLTGEVPYRTEAAARALAGAGTLPERLALYRAAIAAVAPLRARRRRGPRIDRALGDIIERCLARDPNARFPSVESVLEALRAREQARARRPLVVVGVVGPLLLLAMLAVVGGRSYSRALADSKREVEVRAQESNHFAAQFAAAEVAARMDRYFHAVARVAEDAEFQRLFARTLGHAELRRMRERLGRVLAPEPLRAAFIAHPARQPLQRYFERVLADPGRPRAASWFVVDADGTQIAAAFDAPDARQTVGANYAYRTYFHGGPEETAAPARGHIERTHLSAAFKSTATGTWKIAVSIPLRGVYGFAGVLCLTVEIGHFMKFERRDDQFAVLIDGRAGPQRGIILQHPLYDELLGKHRQLPARFSQQLAYRVPAATLERAGALPLFEDPLGQDAEGRDSEGPRYDGLFIAAKAPVRLEGVREGGPGVGDTGLVVLVEEKYLAALQPVRQLGRRLVSEAVSALCGVVLVTVFFWYFLLDLSNKRAENERRRA